MRLKIAPPLALAFAVGVAACSSDDPVANEPSNIVGNLAVETLPVDESDGSPPVNGGATAQPPSADVTIPAALQGRWGLVPADCTSTRGDAKGLLTVSARELRFYESVAKPAADVSTLPDAVSGSFNFTGEGQTWTRHEALKLEDGKLVRTESDPMGSYTYARCS